jgi:hypothetical protein
LGAGKEEKKKKKGVSCFHLLKTQERGRGEVEISQIISFLFLDRVGGWGKNIDLSIGNIVKCFSICMSK